MDATEKAKRLKAKSDQEGDTKVLTDTIESQSKLIGVLESSLDTVLNLVLEGERVLEEETIDDTIGLNTMKKELGSAIRQITAWNDKQDKKINAT